MLFPIGEGLQQPGFHELARLPVSYRLPLLLCAIEGLSREEAARRLNWPIGSVKGRLERGRELLRTRLAALDLGAKQ